MTDPIASVIEPFVRRGLFSSPEQAITQMARDYVLRQIEHHRATIERLHTKYGMTYELFNDYLRARAQTLIASPSRALNQAIMTEEEDALDWKIATEMLQSWLGIETESHA